MAQAAGFIVPYYTATGWGGAYVPDGEALPVLGGYVDAPWADHVQEMPANTNFIFLLTKWTIRLAPTSVKRREQFYL